MIDSTINSSANQVNSTESFDPKHRADMIAALQAFVEADNNLAVFVRCKALGYMSDAEWEEAITLQGVDWEAYFEMRLMMTCFVLEAEGAML
jgi:hypothetical protein